jgi:AraC family transcriptional regulator
VRERLHDGFAEPAALTGLAAMAGVHVGHLTRMFRRHYGRSIGAYQRAARVEWAARRLAAGEPLAAIAAGAGFADQSHFTRAFKRHFGSTPARYRAALRG